MEGQQEHNQSYKEDWTVKRMGRLGEGQRDPAWAKNHLASLSEVREEETIFVPQNRTCTRGSRGIFIILAG